MRGPTAVALGATRCGASVRAKVRQLAVTFTGGHELARGDSGRPIQLMAAGLGVTPEQFRRAFSGVHRGPGARTRSSTGTGWGRSS